MQILITGQGYSITYEKKYDYRQKENEIGEILKFNADMLKSGFTVIKYNEDNE